MTLLLLDVRHALRALRRRRGFAVAVVSTLAIGFAVNISWFTMYRAVLLRPLPVPEAEDLVFLHRLNTTRGYYSSASYPLFTEFRDRVAPVLSIAAYTQSDETLKIGREVERRSVVYVTGDYFSVLRVPPRIGRAIGSENAQQPLVVLSDRVWQLRFASDPGVIGRPITVDGRPFTVLGVMPPWFTGLDPGAAADIWVPLSFSPVFAERIDRRGTDWLEVVGRWNVGNDGRAGRARAAEIVRSLRTDPDTRETWTAVLSPGEQGNLYPHVRERIGRLLRSFSVFGLLVLVVAAANVANLFASRAIERHREVAVRGALGASRARLTVGFLIEGTVLAAAAGFLSLLLTLWVPAALGSFLLPGDIPVSTLGVDFDAAMVMSVLLLSVMVGVSVGAVVAAQSSPNAMVFLRASGAGPDRRRSRIQQSMVAVQIAGCLVVVIFAALLVRSLRGQLALNPAFRSDRIVLMSIGPQHLGGAPAIQPEALEELEQRIRGIRGVEATGWTAVVPYGAMRMRRGVIVDGSMPEPLPMDANVVSPGFFETLGIPLVRGRPFTDADRRGAPLAAIVNETMAARFWPGEDAVGKIIRGGAAAPPCTVVGVVRDTRFYDIRTLRAPQRPYLYLPLFQNPQARLTLLVRRDREDREISGALREHLRAIAPDAPVSMSTAAEHVDRTLSQERMAALLGSGIALLALGLAGVGLYGVMSQAVHQRVREIAVRMALGARRADIQRMVLRDGLVLTIAGMAAGTAAAIPLTGIVAGLLRDVAPLHLPSFLGSAVLVAAISMVVLLLPAALAGRVDPGTALRAE